MRLTFECEDPTAVIREVGAGEEHGLWAVRDGEGATRMVGAHTAAAALEQLFVPWQIGLVEEVCPAGADECGAVPMAIRVSDGVDEILVGDRQAGEIPGKVSLAVARALDIGEGPGGAEGVEGLRFLLVSRG